MKVLILGDINSPHILKWVNSLFEKKCKIVLVTLSQLEERISLPLDVKIYTFSHGSEIFQSESTSLRKLKYLTEINKIRRIVRYEKPHILHAHYASSYGLIGVLTNYHPLIVSIWGSDVFDFPSKNIITSFLIRYVFSRADKLLSTSMFMADEIKKYTNKEVLITPFGVDLEKFNNKGRVINCTRNINIGIVKFLEKNYGIDYLIRAFKLVKDSLVDYNLRLYIVGSGTHELELKLLAKSLGLNDSITFTGRISHSEISTYHKLFDIAVYPSLKESFGVSIIESLACGTPVVASNIGGIKEIVQNEVSGLLVESKNINQIASAIKELVINSSKRRKYGEAGRKIIEDNYDFNKNLEYMISIYKSVTDC